MSTPEAGGLQTTTANDVKATATFIERLPLQPTDASPITDTIYDSSIETDLFKDVQFLVSEGIALSEVDKADCIRLVLAAREAIAHPNQSGYHVKAAGLTESGEIIIGANDENSICDAYAHGETSVMSQVRAQGEEVRMIGFFKPSEKAEDISINPCGACRDVLEQNAPSDLLIAGGNGKDILVVRQLAEFSRDDFDEISVEEVNLDGIDQAFVALDSAAYGYIPEEKQSELYGVSLIGANELTRARGSFYTNAGYDAIPAGLAAATTFNDTVDPSTPEDLSEIVVVGLGKIPHLLYRDRAALLELDEILRKGGRTIPLPIYLVAVDPETFLPLKAQVTNTEECFPNPFSAGAFGMTEALDRNYKALFDEKI
jgi:cytidine deaminase